MGEVVPVYNYLLDKLEAIKTDKHVAFRGLVKAAEACEKKLKIYYIRTDLSPACAVATGIYFLLCLLLP